MKGDAFIEVVRVARSLGSMESVIPIGFTLQTVPFPIFDAISRALLILNWQENLPDEEMPHRTIWFDDERLADHFEDVKHGRARESGGATKWDDSNSKKNEIAKDLVVG